MKLKIYKKLKIGLICLVSIIIALLSGLIYHTLKFPVTETKNVSVYNYNNKVDIGYQVLLKPNTIFESSSIGEGNVYIFEITDKIKVKFDYSFSGDRNAKIYGDYEIIALVEGYTGNKDKGEKKTIWSKENPLVGNTVFGANGNDISISREISIDLHEFQSYVQHVIDNYKINTSTILTVFMNINMKAETDKGTVDEKMSPGIYLPLNVNMFEVYKDSVEKPGEIKETQKIKLPLDTKKVIMLCILLFISIAALLSIVIFTSGDKVSDPSIKNLNRIFRQYGSRMVALEPGIQARYEKCYNVRSMEDLVRVADELEKPVVYEYSSNNIEITQFYVFEETTMYVFDFQRTVNMADEVKLHEKADSSGEQSILL